MNLKFYIFLLKIKSAVVQGYEEKLERLRGEMRKLQETEKKKIKELEGKNQALEEAAKYSAQTLESLNSQQVCDRDVFTVPKRSLRRLCFYTCLSVILFTEGVCLNVCWDTLPETMHPPRSTPTPGPGTPLGPDSTHPRSKHPSRADNPPVSRHPLTGPGTPSGADTPSAQCMLGDTVNKWAVCILLECNLVFLYCYP